MNCQQFTNQGKSLIKLNKFPEAKFFFEKALELRPDFADALTNFAIFEHKLGNLDQAVRLYKKFSLRL
jgi:tetratricopeptide (TPR) repeat protein